MFFTKKFVARLAAAPGWKRSTWEVFTPNYCAAAVSYSEHHSVTQRTAANFGPIYGPYTVPILLWELKPAPFPASEAVSVAAPLVSFRNN